MKNSGEDLHMEFPITIGTKPYFDKETRITPSISYGNMVEKKSFLPQGFSISSHCDELMAPAQFSKRKTSIHSALLYSSLFFSRFRPVRCCSGSCWRRPVYQSGIPNRPGLRRQQQRPRPFHGRRGAVPTDLCQPRRPKADGQRGRQYFSFARFTSQRWNCPGETPESTKLNPEIIEIIVSTFFYVCKIVSHGGLEYSVDFFFLWSGFVPEPITLDWY